MATDEEIRAKDVVPKLTKFREGDGLYGDGQTSFFMEHQDLAKNVIEDSAENTAATESDMVAGSKIPIMTADGPKALPGNAIANASDVTALQTKITNIAASIAPEYNGTTGAVAGKFYMNGGVLYKCKEDTSGDFDSSKFDVASLDDFLPFLADAIKQILFDSGSGGFVISDNSGCISLQIDATGNILLKKMSSPSDVFSLYDNNGNISFFIDPVGNIRGNFSIETLQKNLKEKGLYLIGCGSDYFMCSPKYVFGIESSTLRGREYFTAIYPEGMVEIDDKQFFIEEFRKKLVQKRKSTSSTDSTSVTTELVRSYISSPLYEKKDFCFDYIRANRLNAQNKKIFWLAIGDSLTARTAQTFPDGTVYGGYVNGVKQFSAMDNADVGDIDVVTLGTLNGETRTINYDGNDITCKTINAGHGGWTTWDFANFFTHTPLQNSSSSSYLSKEALYYALGLATKTPFDSSTPGQEYAAYSESAATTYLLVSTPIGRYKPDCNSVLWDALKLRSDFSGVGDYDHNTSDSIINAYFDAKENDPTNEFYSLTKARAYTGDHVWTYDCAFSIGEYLGRYRTYDDDGTQLTLGEGTGSKVTSNNINTYVVMTPTHVTVGTGANDSGITEEQQKDIVMLLMNAITSELSSAHVGYFLPRNTGVYNVGNWTERGLMNHKSGKPSTRSVRANKMIMDAIGPLPSGAGLSYIPVHFTSSPISTSGYDRVVEDIDSGDKLIVAGTDSYHPSAYWYKSTAYQLLAWIYWTLRT